MIGLLDTHSFLWAVVAPEKLSAKMRAVIADPANEIHVSTISFWEIALKYSLGKLQMSGCSPEDLVGIGRQMGLTISAPSAEESAGFHRLPRVQHKDPFDRMLVWLCLQRRWTLITRDRHLGDYRSLGLLAAW
ncbi:MAG: type II toxin-antitoxin system VapC family toxin [Gammaproteobacteria bacterium]